MTKDRLTEMKTIMAEHGITGSKEGLVPEERSDVMDSFFEQMGAIKLEVQRIKNRVQILKKFHVQIEKCTIDNVRKELQKKIEDEQQIIMTSASNTRATLKSVQDLFSSKKVTPAMMRMRDVQISSQMKMLTDTMHEYMDCLTTHRERSVQLLKVMIQVKDGDETTEDVEALLEQGKTAFFVNNLLIDTLEERVSEVECRHKEILAVERSIMELRNLFTELAFAVTLQGDTIVQLDQQVGKSMKKVEKARTDVVSAKRKASRRRKRKVMMVAICIIVVAILLFILLIV